MFIGRLMDSAYVSCLVSGGQNVSWKKHMVCCTLLENRSHCLNLICLIGEHITWCQCVLCTCVFGCIHVFVCLSQVPWRGFSWVSPITKSPLVCPGELYSRMQLNTLTRMADHHSGEHWNSFGGKRNDFQCFSVFGEFQQNWLQGPAGKSTIQGSHSSFEELETGWVYTAVKDLCFLISLSFWLLKTQIQIQFIC